VASERGTIRRVRAAVKSGRRTGERAAGGARGGLVCSLTPTTLLRVLADLVDSLERQGLRKLVLLNGHGGDMLWTL
jgi:Creatinine amidohydrolase